MKTSNIILSTYIGLLAIGFTVAIIKHSSALNNRTELNQLKEISTAPFNKINLTGNLHVTLVQSHEQKVAIDGKWLSSGTKPKIEVTDSTLWVDVLEIKTQLNNPVRLSIYTPALEGITTNKVKQLNIDHWNSTNFKLDAKASQISIKGLQTQHFEISATEETWINIDSCKTQSLVLLMNNAGLNIHKGHIQNASGILMPKGKFHFGCAIDSVQLGIDKTSTLNKYW